MLALFETPAGFALFNLSDEKKIEDADNVFKLFEQVSEAHKTYDFWI